MSHKSETRCATAKCIKAIQQYGEHYHSVYPRDEGCQCERCGGKFDGTAWLHKCKQCGTEVEPGELTGLFVPHSCKACMEKVVEQQTRAGKVCGRCKTVFAFCCC
jgi:hypothetical protein